MFGLQVLDVAIGLIFTFLTLALVGMVIVEGISQLLSMRSRNLEDAIRNMLGSDSSKAKPAAGTPATKGLADLFYAHSLIRDITAPGLRLNGGKPSYIPAQTFSTVLFDLIDFKPPTKGQIDVAIARLADSPRKTLLQITSNAGIEADRFDLAAKQIADVTARMFDVVAPPSSGAALTLKDVSTALDNLPGSVLNGAPHIGQARDMLKHLAVTSQDLSALRKSVEDLSRSDGLLADVLLPRDAAAGSRTILSLRETINGFNDPHLKASLIPLLDRAQDDLKQCRVEIEGWFDSVMERASGWYKRRTDFIAALAVLVLVLMTNSDAISLAKTLYRDPQVRASFVTAAQQYLEQNKELPADPNEAIKAIEPFVNQIEWPLGWNDVPAGSLQAQWVVEKILGLLIMWLAASLGAPFWFDVLNKIMRVRSSGILPTHESSSTAPTPQTQRGGKGMATQPTS